MEWQGCLNVLRGNKYACEENTLCIADTIILNAQTMCVSLSLCVWEWFGGCNNYNLGGC
jgi:hypothetical protein